MHHHHKLYVYYFDQKRKEVVMLTWILQLSNFNCMFHLLHELVTVLVAFTVCPILQQELFKLGTCRPAVGIPGFLKCDWIYENRPYRHKK